MIEYHNPEANVGTEPIPYDLALKISSGEQVTVGLLANGFPDSEEFLEEVGRALQALEPGIRIRAYNKGNASIPANEELVSEVGRDCAGVVAAYGH